MNLIELYEFGRIKVGGKEYNRDLIIFRDRIYPNWWREEGHSLCLEDLKIIFDSKPKILVIGCGYSGAMSVPKNVIKKLEENGIKVIVKKTKEAVKEFNNLLKKGENVAAALHLTC